MENRLNFWEQPEWIKIKTFIAKTEKLLSRVEYLKLLGWENYSDENYKKYLEVMQGESSGMI
jgi:hypothetical protein